MNYIQTFESFLNESGPEVIFSVDDDKLDQMLNARFSSQLDYKDITGDSYYSLPKRDFDRFIDLADSSGFDVDYDNSEDSVIYVYESKVNEANAYKITDFPVNSLIEFKDGEIWKVVKADMRASNSQVKGDEITIKPDNKLAKEKNVSLAIDVTLEYLNANVLKITK
jgi:hypothetical protein